MSHKLLHKLVLSPGAVMSGQLTYQKGEWARCDAPRGELENDLKLIHVLYDGEHVSALACFQRRIRLFTKGTGKRHQDPELETNYSEYIYSSNV